MMDETGQVPASAVAEAGRSHLNKVFKLLAALGGKTSPAEQLEEDTFRIREGFHNYRLDPVEAQAPAADLSGIERPSDTLDFFARMMQRTQLIGHFVHDGIEIPVHYAITGAILLERKSRKFSVWGQPNLRNSVVLPFNFVKDKSIIDQFKGDSDLRLVDSGGDRAEYTQLRISAVRKSRLQTLEQRSELLKQWVPTEGSNTSRGLVVSGTVFDIPNSQLGSNVFALGRRVYVPWENSEILEPQLLIPADRRGQLMKITDTTGKMADTKYTWFVRLRTSAKADPEFGLVRCTCIARSDEEAIAKATAFSSRLMDERLPVTFPAETWDKLIFPLKLCLDYLSSLVPTQNTVKSYFARD